jgi:hypothetical protein
VKKSVLLLLIGMNLAPAFSWGFFGHRKINEIAIYTLPKPLFGFYKYHCRYMAEHSADPDKRRYIIETEACKHFLDGVGVQMVTYVYHDSGSGSADGVEPWTCPNC